MRIAIVTPSPIPFVVGGAEKLFMGMLYHFSKLTSHRFDLIKIPVKDQDFWRLMWGYYDFYKLDLTHFDAVLVTKYPAWMIRHPNKILYMQHTCRGVYDLYPFDRLTTDFKSITKVSNKLSKLENLLENKDTKPFDLFEELFYLYSIRHNLPPGVFDFPNPLTRAIIHKLDRMSFLDVKSFNAISKNVSQRKDYFPEDAKVKVIYHPSSLENLHCSSYKYIFTASRLEKLKRVDLLIKAFKKIDNDIDFLIAGTGSEENYLKELAKDDERVKFLGFVSDHKLVELYSNALFVPFIPYDEDYGLITIEAMSSSKPVLTTIDSGGVKELVKSGYNGIITEPNVDKIADAMRLLISDLDKTIKMGKNAEKTVKAISWENLSANLFDENYVNKRFFFNKSTPKPIKVLTILNTFSIEKRIFGGQIRIYNLYKYLTDMYEVRLLCLSDGKDYEEVQIEDNFFEVRIPKTEEFKKAEAELHKKLGVPATDIAMMLFHDSVPMYLYEVKKSLINSFKIVIEHPYTYPLFRSLLGGLSYEYYYSSHNAEYMLKSQMFNDQEILDKLYTVEKRCILNSKCAFDCYSGDIDYFKNEYKIDKEIKLIPNGVDISKYANIKREPSNIAIFIGSYHKPNIEAVNFILKVAKKLSSYKFVIIGSVENGFKNYITPSNVCFTGVLDEDEKIEYLSKAYVALNPMTSGAGSNLKVLEYAAAKVPILSSKFGIRGFHLKGVGVYDSFDDFIYKFERIHQFTDPELAYNSAKAYDWKKLSSSLIGCLTKT